MCVLSRCPSHPLPATTPALWTALPGMIAFNIHIAFLKHIRFNGRLSVIDWKTSSKYDFHAACEPVLTGASQAAQDTQAVLRLW